MSTVYGLGCTGNDRGPPDSVVVDGFREVHSLVTLYEYRIG